MATSAVVSRGLESRTSPRPGSVEPPWDSVRELYQLLRGATQAALGPSGLLLSEYGALAVCAQSPVPLKSITRTLGVTPAATTDLARRLAQRGLIRLAAHPTDRRSRVASLTESGHQLLRRAKEDQKRALRGLGVMISPQARQGLRRGVAELRWALAGPETP